VPFHVWSVLWCDGNKIGSSRGLEFRTVDILIIFAGTRRVNNALSSLVNLINIKARYIKVYSHANAGCTSAKRVIGYNSLRAPDLHVAPGVRRKRDWSSLINLLVEWDKRAPRSFAEIYENWNAKQRNSIN